MRERYNPPEVREFRRAMYDPHFMRAFLTLGCCQRKPDVALWCEDAEHCLDRTEV